MKRLLKILLCLVPCALCLISSPAHADWAIVDNLSLAPMVPIVLDAFMSAAMAMYSFFVGGGNGIIYILIWGFLAVFIVMYLVKMYFPASWLKFFGMSPSEDLWAGKTDGFKIGQNLLKPVIRAAIAAAILLPLKPVYFTNFIIDPFLRFGAIYTDSISATIGQANAWGGVAPAVECPKTITDAGWISPESCRFLVQPVADVTHANNIAIKRGLSFFTDGLTGLLTPIPHGGEDFMNLITGAVLVITFVSNNFFIALLIIQGIFWLGMALILYPFRVLMYVAKPANKDAWVDPWDAFSDIISALKTLVITMIASMFIMAINIAAIGALFHFDNAVFMQAAGGSAASNLPSVATGSQIGFGAHSITWISAILTFYLMFRIIELTREKIKQYSAAGTKPKYATKDIDLYKQTKDDATKTWNNSRDFGKKTSKTFGWVKDKIKKK